MMPTTEQPSPAVISKKAGGFTICHFSHAGDLLLGINALRSFHIPIHEVYTPIYIEGLKSRLEIKKWKVSYIILKYGCFGGASLTSIVCSTNNMTGAVLLLFAFVFASWLMATKPPKIIKYRDPRFLIVIKTKNIIPDEGIASFLRYSGSVEITQTVKKMLIN